MKSLLQLRPATELYLVLEMDKWLAMADEIRRGRCNIKNLALTMITQEGASTKNLQALASAIQLDCNMEHLTLGGGNGFTDEAGVALAEALTVNKTLRKIDLSALVYDSNMHNKATLGASAYEAFSAMLRINTSLDLKLPPFGSAGADERLLESREQMEIEQRLNKVGRGRLMASRQTTREEYADALNELNSCNVGYSPAFQVSCLYSLLRLHPSVYMS
jgi:hypothetical protein